MRELISGLVGLVMALAGYGSGEAEFFQQRREIRQQVQSIGEKIPDMLNHGINRESVKREINTVIRHYVNAEGFRDYIVSFSVCNNYATPFLVYELSTQKIFVDEDYDGYIDQIVGQVSLEEAELNMPYINFACKKRMA